VDRSTVYRAIEQQRNEARAAPLRPNGTSTSACQTRVMAKNVVDIAEKLSLFTEHWSPKVVARLNDYEIKVVKVRGEFVWHTHEDTDELFLVVAHQHRRRRRISDFLARRVARVARYGRHRHPALYRDQTLTPCSSLRGQPSRARTCCVVLQPRQLSPTPGLCGLLGSCSRASSRGWSTRTGSSCSSVTAVPGR